MNRRQPVTLTQIAVVITLIVLLVLVMLPLLRDARERQNRYACATNLKQWGIIFRMYQHENREGVHPTATTLGLNGMLPRQSVDSQLLYPDYWTDPHIAVCPSDDLDSVFERFGFPSLSAWLDAIAYESREGSANLRRHDDAGGTGAERTLNTPVAVTEEGHALLSIPQSYVYLGRWVESSAALADAVGSRIELLRSADHGLPESVSRTGQLTWRRWPSSLRVHRLASTRPDWLAPGHAPEADEEAALPLEYLLYRDFHADIFNVEFHRRQRIRQRTWVVMWDAWGEGGHRFEELGLTTVERRPSHREHCNVLFWDGHVEYVPLGQTPAFSEGTPGTLGERLGAVMALASGSVVRTADEAASTP